MGVPPITSPEGPYLGSVLTYSSWLTTSRNRGRRSKFMLKADDKVRISRMAPLNAPNILIRIRHFDGAHLQFFPHDDPTARESLPLAAEFHQIAANLPPNRLCRASILNGVIVVLKPTKTLDDRM